MPLTPDEFAIRFIQYMADEKNIEKAKKIADEFFAERNNNYVDELALFAIVLVRLIGAEEEIFPYYMASIIYSALMLLAGIKQVDMDELINQLISLIQRREMPSYVK